MKSILFNTLLLLLIGLTLQSAPQFRKTVVDTLFRSEGVGFGDVNKDGSNDILVGDFWYQAPDWKAHEIRKPRKPNRGGYTEAFAVYPDDYNRDGWIDVMVIPFHGKPAKWYENPKGAEGHWKERVAFKGNALPSSAMRCLQVERVAFKCNSLPSSATRCLQVQRVAFKCSALPSSATSCLQMQRVAFKCNTLPSSATRCLPVHRVAFN